MFIRSTLTLPFIAILILVTNQTATMRDLSISLPFLLINGFLLFGISKILWIESIHRISVTKATSLGSVNPVFTLIFAFLILGDIPTIIQITAFIPLFIGILFLTSKDKVKLCVSNNIP